MTTYRAKMLINAVESASTMIPSKASRQESTFSVFHAAERNEKKQKNTAFHQRVQKLGDPKPKNKILQIIHPAIKRGDIGRFIDDVY